MIIKDFFDYRIRMNYTPQGDGNFMPNLLKLYQVLYQHKNE